MINFPMPIKTEHLIIQPPKAGDGEILFEAVLESYDDLNQAMPWTKTILNVNDAEEFARQSEANWILKNNNEPYLPLYIFKKTEMKLKFIGITGFHHMNWEIPSFEMGYWLRRTERECGFMTEAINALTRYAMLVFHAKRIEIRCDRINIRSKKIPERLGYLLEATLKNHRINSLTNNISDTFIYSRYDLENLPPLQVDWT